MTALFHTIFHQPVNPVLPQNYTHAPTVAFSNYSHLLWFLRRLLTHEVKPRNKLHEDNKIRSLKAFYLTSNGKRLSG